MEKFRNYKNKNKPSVNNIYVNMLHVILAKFYVIFFTYFLWCEKYFSLFDSLLTKYITNKQIFFIVHINILFYIEIKVVNAFLSYFQ